MASLALAAVQIYLTLNKLWNRKHEKVVAESISIYGELLGLIPLFFLTLSFFLDRQWEGMVDGVLWLGAGAITIAIGTGKWVEGRRSLGYWALLREALALERSEVGNLARSFFRPSGAEKVVDLLTQVALIDEDLDERERAFIQSFVDGWGVELSWDEVARRRPEQGLDKMRLRNAAAEYLRTSPPPRQAEQLADVIVALVHADEEVTVEEDMMLAEVGGMLSSYVHGGADRPQFSVVLVPQSDQEEQAIQAVLPGMGSEDVAGGRAYVVGRYFSDAYAAMVTEQYHALNVFTTVLREPAG